ncbi:MAG: hypothetical protein LBM08_03945 [Dysgonamonadaceae bacterium]|jgi:hypothetical protein|nr:hypothetical protein [Dysgonamonadaceae bacterium]
MTGGIFIDFFIRLKQWNGRRKLRNAINKADWMARRTGQKFFVFKYRSSLVVKSKQEIKRLIREKYFTRDFTIHVAERMALYITRN